VPASGLAEWSRAQSDKVRPKCRHPANGCDLVNTEEIWCRESVQPSKHKPFRNLWRWEIERQALPMAQLLVEA